MRPSDIIILHSPGPGTRAYSLEDKLLAGPPNSLYASAITYIVKIPHQVERHLLARNVTAKHTRLHPINDDEDAVPTYTSQWRVVTT